MKKSYTVEKTCNGMRIDRWIRYSLGSIPQGLIEKHLRAGKIKLNKKKIKSSHKVKTNDEVAKEIDADWLIYQTLDDLIDTVQVGNPEINEFETSIFTGKYIFLPLYFYQLLRRLLGTEVGLCNSRDVQPD